MIKFENTYIKLPDNFYEKVMPTSFPDPKLIVFNESLARDLEIELNGVSDAELAMIFSGQKILKGSEPIAMAYAGFQFGHPVPQLGDGRAHLLGEVKGFDIQLKGSGQTKFSRRGDGRSALGPVLREYIVSEAMHVLGVPTTRALCATTTGENVVRQYGEEPGGVFTRVAASHLRVGTFQYFAFKQDINSIKLLLDYTIQRHYPEIACKDYQSRALEFLKALTLRQADLIAMWSSYGFIHGVMNTDNFSVAGITIDYGPCAFMDEFKFEKVFSSIDKNGRYAFFNQVPIAKWNMLRLAECLIPLIADTEEKAIEIIEHELMPLFDQFDYKRFEAFAKKLGIKNYESQDEKLVLTFLEYLEENSIDFTLAFRNLSDLFHDQSDFYPSTQKLTEFVSDWKKRVSNVDDLKLLNPLFIPRNHQIQKAIEMAYEGDYSHFFKLHEVLKKPFIDNTNTIDFSLPPKPSEKVYQTFCGT